jgi:hypothetical protein
MEKSSKRGKIPQQDWPSIIKRYEAGETLASIARTYDCSPPAISYIVSRTRARSAAAEAAAPKPAAPAEPQLIKASSSPMPTNGIPADEATHNSAGGGVNTGLIMPVAEPVSIERAPAAPEPSASGLFPDQPPPPHKVVESQSSPEIDRAAPRYVQGQRDVYRGDHAVTPSPMPSPSGGPAHNAGGPGHIAGRPGHIAGGPGHNAGGPGHNAGGPSQNGEARRTLHLSLSQANGAGGDSHSPHAQNAVNPAHGSDNRLAARPQSGQPGFAQQPRQAAGPALPFGPPPSPMGAVRGPAIAPSDAQRAREGGAFIDHALRERIDGDIAAFLAAFDAALDHDTAESRTGLREATDRLLRAGARTRIELERLEARVPLGSRDKDPHASSLFRPR